MRAGSSVVATVTAGSATNYTDTTAATQDVDVNHFYRVVARGSDASMLATSDAVGEFTVDRSDFLPGLTWKAHAAKSSVTLKALGYKLVEQVFETYDRFRCSRYRRRHIVRSITRPVLA